jgi:hypothetical protein
MLGWNTGFESIMPRGHEILTERALKVSAPGSRGIVTFTSRGTPITTVVAPAEVSAIIEGNRAVDVADLRRTQGMLSTVRAKPYLVPLLGPVVGGAGAAYSAGEAAGFVVHSLNEDAQKRHALRRSRGQDWRDALREIIAFLREQHIGMLADANPQSRLARIGAILHLIQDSYCPAHTDRGANGCIQYVRNYGVFDSPVWQRSGAGREHSFPTDARDNIHAHPVLAGAAVEASAQYLQIVFKILYARANSDPLSAAEAAREFETFVPRHLTAC